MNRHTHLGHNGHAVDGAPPRRPLCALPQPLAAVRVLPLQTLRGTAGAGMKGLDDGHEALSGQGGGG